MTRLLNRKCLARWASLRVRDGLVALKLTVNDRESLVSDALANVPLAFVLRNDLGLTSVRLGCGLEQCGSCKVLIGGKPQYSCRLSVGDVSGPVRTVEGLAAESYLHPVQRALLEHNAGQCGYCLSGIVIAAVALFEHNPSPDRQTIVAALDPHLCRCGAHPRILRALLALAESPDVA